MSEEKTRTGTVNSVLRAVSILECFAYGKREWNLVELAETLSLPVSTLHRQLNTLVEHNFLQQEPGGKRYLAGPSLISFAYAIMGKYDLRNLARPAIRKLSESVGETIHLTQLNGFEMFYIDKVESIHSVRCASHIGERIPAHVTGSGKALISGFSEEQLDEYCAFLPTVPAYTENTIRDGATLRSVLHAIREQGYATDDEEREMGLFCVAAPIHDVSGAIVAAVSVAGPDFRVRQNLERYIPLVKTAAQEISRALGVR